MDYRIKLEKKYKELLTGLYSELSEKQIAEILYDETFNFINNITKKEILRTKVNERTRKDDAKMKITYSGCYWEGE